MNKSEVEYMLAMSREGLFRLSSRPGGLHTRLHHYFLQMHPLLARAHEGASKKPTDELRAALQVALERGDGDDERGFAATHHTFRKRVVRSALYLHEVLSQLAVERPA